MSKHGRIIYPVTGSLPPIDVYAVLDAFQVTCPARQHAIKKLLCTGLRGKGDTLRDLREAKASVQRAIELEQVRAEPEEWTNPDHDSPDDDLHSE